jgi:hypothetical protein
MVNKKLTYKELEKKNRKLKYKELRQSILFVIVSIFCLTVLILYLDNKENDNQQLKYQLNNTEGKNYSFDFVGAIKPEDTRNCEDKKIEKPKEEEVDYHSSEELFCEHYNGTYFNEGLSFGKNTLWCYFLKEDIKHSCKLDYVNNQFVWEEPCEAIQ